MRIIASRTGHLSLNHAAPRFNHFIAREAQGMKTHALILVVAAALTAAAPQPSSKKTGIFTGTWCVGREGLVITFVGGDSIHVGSLSDSTVNGRGTYRKSGDSLFATLHKEDLVLEMGYRYRVREDASVRARILFFTVNGDSVNHPLRWMRMKRCDPAKGIMPQFEEEDEEEEEE
jgi:hypothetical protein